ncbi:hypothetical protein DY000_02049206 [Brassica cretica]|uniref:Uncharacterized protein n=1 Tax=Brassica cretica TaxID=69181 RepID=A0ABQ7ESK5_BRACR|nr:hypothetical protein DY000_02049206 [Brassica cretica]
MQRILENLAKTPENIEPRFRKKGFDGGARSVGSLPCVPRADSGVLDRWGGYVGSRG